MPNPLRADPTRTKTLRNKFIGDNRKRFRTLKGQINQLIVKDDVFGLKADSVTFNMIVPGSFVPNPNLLETFVTNVEPKAWRFATDAQKLTNFNTWLAQQLSLGFLTLDNEGDPYTNTYVRQSYEKGLRRAAVDTAKVQRLPATTSLFAPSTDQVVAGLINAPKNLDKVALLASRTFENLKGITSHTSLQLNRILSDAFIQGLGPREIARQMTSEIDTITRVRANTLARTEIIHAHAEGQLDSFEDLGIEELMVMPEWHTAGDERVCPLCQPLEGAIMTLEQARGLIPRHPNCRCAWIPAFVETEDQAANRLQLKQSIKKSLTSAPKNDRWVGRARIKIANR